MGERPGSLWDRTAPSRPRLSVRLLLGLSLAACLFLLVLQAWWILTPSAAIRPGPLVVEIPARSGFLDVARILDRARVIRSPAGFVLLTVVRGSMRTLKAGEYQIPQGANTTTVLALLEAGRVLPPSLV